MFFPGVCYDEKNGYFRKKIISHRDFLISITFSKFKHDVGNIIDDSKLMIVDIEEIENDINIVIEKMLLTMFLLQNLYVIFWSDFFHIPFVI